MTERGQSPRFVGSARRVSFCGEGLSVTTSQGVSAVHFESPVHVFFPNEGVSEFEKMGQPQESNSSSRGFLPPFVGGAAARILLCLGHLGFGNEKPGMTGIRQHTVDLWTAREELSMAMLHFPDHSRGHCLRLGPCFEGGLRSAKRSSFAIPLAGP